MKPKNQSSLILINQVLNFILEKNLIFSKIKILAAFSGGQDSYFLIILMLQFMNQFNFHFGLIYCNHLWHLNNLLKFSHLLKASYLLNIPLFFMIASKKMFTEKEARIWRYLTIYRISEFYHYEMILTGHTLTDQAETLLLNLLRSSSKDGATSLFLNQFLANTFLKKNFLARYELKSQK